MDSTIRAAVPLSAVDVMQVTHASSRSLQDRPAHAGALWFGFLCGPLAALSNEAIEYVLVAWSCGRFDSVSRILLHVVPAALIVLCIIAALVGWGIARAAGGEESGTAEDHRMHAARSNRAFMGLVAVGLSALGALVILSQWIPVLYLNPCAMA
ncbi:MAG TPA: hypothetical protein VLI40_05095 [Gemmatimonadaceae bacterium]|nr:hypothetical protein [Gemmatimonadaceae bacterium]